MGNKTNTRSRIPPAAPTQRLAKMSVSIVIGPTGDRLTTPLLKYRKDAAPKANRAPFPVPKRRRTGSVFEATCGKFLHDFSDSIHFYPAGSDKIRAKLWGRAFN